MNWVAELLHKSEKKEGILENTFFVVIKIVAVQTEGLKTCKNETMIVRRQRRR